MSDDNTKKTVSEEPVSDAGFPEFISSIARAVNQTYSYNDTSSLFCSLVPAYDRDYIYRYVRVACQWLDGYVPTLHDGNSGIMSTRIGQKLITGLTKQITGEKLIYKLADDVDTDEDTLRFISKWSEKKNPFKAVFSGVGYALGIGTSLVKLNVSYSSELTKESKPDVWWEAKRLDQCFYLADNEDVVKEATFYIRNYTDTRQLTDGQPKQQYMLVEHRFWQVYDKPVLRENSLEVVHAKGERVPMVEYNVYCTNGTILQNTMPIYRSTKKTWDELPKEIREMIKTNYGTMRIGEPIRLPFTNLGVEIFKNAPIDLSVPTGSGFGESLLVGVQDNMITYEFAEGCQLRDMHVGKGTVYLPKSMSMGDINPNVGAIANGGVLTELKNNNAFQLMPGVDPEQQKIMTTQFELRVNDWQAIKDNCLKDIAVKWGMSAKILASYLAQGTAAQTATQVDSEDDISIAFINLTRSYFINPINKLMETTLSYYGKVNNISVSFATPTLVNKDRLLDRIIKLLENGLIDVEEAIRTYYPDISEDEVKRKIEIANAEREKAMQQQQADLDPFGDNNGMDNFGNGNNYQDLGGDNLNGTTKPTNEIKPN